MVLRKKKKKDKLVARNLNLTKFNLLSCSNTLSCIYRVPAPSTLVVGTQNNFSEFFCLDGSVLS